MSRTKKAQTNSLIEQADMACREAIKSHRTAYKLMKQKNSTLETPGGHHVSHWRLTKEALQSAYANFYHIARQEYLRSGSSVAAPALLEVTISLERLLSSLMASKGIPNSFDKIYVEEALGKARAAIAKAICTDDIEVIDRHVEEREPASC